MHKKLSWSEGLKVIELRSKGLTEKDAILQVKKDRNKSSLKLEITRTK